MIQMLVEHSSLEELRFDDILQYIKSLDESLIIIIIIIIFLKNHL